MSEHLKRLGSIWTLLATQTKLSRFVEERDKTTFLRRVEGEGMAFLTVTLPRLYKALDRSFQTGGLATPTGFVVEKGHNYPRFLRRAWESIYSKDGVLLSPSMIDVDAVDCIRQLSAVFYKLELPYTTDQCDQTIASFREAEDDLKYVDLRDPSITGLLASARRIVCAMLDWVDPSGIVPAHGKGASACRVVPWERYESFRYIPRLAREFPYDKHFFYNLSHLADELSKLVEAEECDPAARVVFVPKDSRGPRLISCEPREFMYIQQGLMHLLYGTVGRNRHLSDSIGFTDQSRNQLYAVIGSCHERSKTRDNPAGDDDLAYATLDLKEASDRVSLELVRSLFPTRWYDALASSRSLATTLPDGSVLPLRKFAPMGSACCFPVEAICFYALSVAAQKLGGTAVKQIRQASLPGRARVSVFGDDIIVHTSQVCAVTSALESVGLVVNRDKSFWRGPFRESCGGDFFNGVPVNPVRLKSLPGDDKQSMFRIADHFNLLIRKYGYSECGLALQLLFEEWYGPVAVTSRYRETRSADGIKGVTLETDGLALIGPYTDIPVTFRRRWNKALQRAEYRTLSEHAVETNIDSDRWSQVLRRNANIGCENVGDGRFYVPSILNVSVPSKPDCCALAKRTRYKYRWVAV